MSSREYAALKILRDGGVLDLDGIKLKKIDRELKPGDLYVAERNTGPKLLTVQEIANNAVFPTCNGYAFDIGECVAVEEVT